MITTLMPLPKQQFLGVLGTPLVGGKVYTYAAGTTDSKPTYTDAAGTIEQPNPIPLNLRGEPTNAIYWSGAYKVELRDALGNLVYTVDNFNTDPAGLWGLLTQLAAAAGSSLVGFIASGVGAVKRLVQDKLRDRISVADFGVVGDGTDETTKLQKAIDALPKNARLDGLGLTCTATTLQLKSNMGLVNINLVTKAGAVDFVSPITIDGRATAKSNIYLADVHVDGNRAQQTAVTSPGPEDGGRHCFRLLGNCSDITMERCSGNNSACDGIELFSSTSVGATDSIYVFNNITLRDCVFNWNRRHGMSADSMKRLHMDNVELKWNGLDLNTADALNHGNRGSRAAGLLYGNGMDFEGYGLGSAFNELHLFKVTALYNARGGCLFYDALDSRPAGFVPRSKIWITDCYFDEGQDASRSGEALTFTSTIASKTLAALYDSVYISNTRLDGFFLARGANNIQYDGEIRTTGYTSYALLDYATNIVLDVVPAGTTKTIYADHSTYSLGKEAVSTPANPTFAQISGAAGTLGPVNVTLLENVRDRTCRFLITTTWVANVAGVAGVPAFRVTPPAGSVLAAPPRVDVTSQNTGVAVVSAYDLTIGSCRFADPGTTPATPFNLQLTVDVKI